MNVLVAFLLLIILIIAVMPFLVLFITLCIKKPKIAALFALVPVAVFVIFYATVSIRNREPSSSMSVRIPKQSSPIWSEGIDQQFDADVYPSKEAATRSIALRLDKESRNLSYELDQLESIVIKRDAKYAELAEALQESILRLYSEIRCRIIRTGTSNINELSISLSTTKKSQTQRMDGTITSEQGIIQAAITYESKTTIISVDYDYRPWVEDFSSFTNSQPDRQYMVAKSSESCLAPEEAEQQAMDNACKMFGPLLLKRRDPIKINSNDIIDSGLIVDKFTQSFDGSVGKIWRQAVLLDVSPEKLNRLAEKIAGVTQASRERRLSTVGSIAGLFVLITIVYIFLNAATKGYYAWSLRIAGVVLALILIFILLA